jgi:hypothetical protein
MSGEDLKVNYLAYKSANADKGTKAPAAEGKQAKPAIEEKKSIPMYMLERIVDLITFAVPASGQEGLANVTNDELNDLNLFSDSNDEVAPYLSGAQKKNIKNNEGNGFDTIEPKTINFSVNKRPYIDASILPYFRSEKYPQMGTIGKILTALDPNTSASFTTPKELIGMFINYQTNCNRYKIYALLHESKDYGPIKIDGVCGRQTAKSLVFVYELGQLAVRFQIVKSFRDYVEIFNGRSKRKLSFKDIVIRIEDIVTRLQQNKTSILNGNPIDNKEGVIKNNVGDAIIELYSITDIKEANMLNIAAQRNRREDDKSVIVLPYIKESDAIQGTNYAAMREAKMILHVLGYYLPDAASIYDFDGTWDGAFDKALKNFGITNKTIDSAASVELFKKGREEYENEKETGQGEKPKAEELYIQVNNKPEIENAKKVEIRNKLDEIYRNYDLLVPEKIAKSIIELRKIISEEKGLLGTLEKVEFLRIHSALKKKYEYLKTVIVDAGGLLKPEEISETKKIEPVINETEKMIKNDEWQEKGKILKDKIDKATADCGFYIVNFLVKVFDRKNGEIKAGIKNIDLDLLPEDDNEVNSMIDKYKQELIVLGKGVDGLGDIISTITAEKAKQETVENAKKIVDGWRSEINAKRNEIEEYVLFLPMYKQRRKLVKMVNDAINEVNAYSNGDELKKIKDKLSADYAGKVKDDGNAVAEQKQLFNKNDITTEKAIKTVNEPGRQANAILSLAQDLNMITDEKRKEFLAKKVTSEIQRLIVAIDARLNGLNMNTIDLGLFAPVSPARATEVLKNRFLVYRQIYEGFSVAKLILESDRNIPENNKKVMPFITACYRLKDNNKKYHDAAKALYGNILSALTEKNANTFRVTNTMNFDDALKAELEGGVVSIASLCLATVIAKFKKIDVADAKRYTIGKQQTEMLSAVKKELYEVILKASREDFGLVEEPKKAEKKVK